jgi:hypothetical protein
LNVPETINKTCVICQCWCTVGTAAVVFDPLDDITDFPYIGDPDAPHVERECDGWGLEVTGEFVWNQAATPPISDVNYWHFIVDPDGLFGDINLSQFFLRINRCTGLLEYSVNRETAPDPWRDEWDVYDDDGDCITFSFTTYYYLADFDGWAYCLAPSVVVSGVLCRCDGSCDPAILLPPPEDAGGASVRTKGDTQSVRIAQAKAPACQHLGDSIKGAERNKRGLTHRPDWRLCEHPKRIELGIAEEVCRCQSCGPKCPGYVRPEA